MCLPFSFNIIFVRVVLKLLGVIIPCVAILPFLQATVNGHAWGGCVYASLRGFSRDGTAAVHVFSFS